MLPVSRVKARAKQRKRPLRPIVMLAVITGIGFYGYSHFLGGIMAPDHATSVAGDPGTAARSAHEHTTSVAADPGNIQAPAAAASRADVQDATQSTPRAIKATEAAVSLSSKCPSIYIYNVSDVVKVQETLFNNSFGQAMGNGNNLYDTEKDEIGSMILSQRGLKDGRRKKRKGEENKMEEARRTMGRRKGKRIERK